MQNYCPLSYVDGRDPAGEKGRSLGSPAEGRGLTLDASRTILGSGSADRARQPACRRELPERLISPSFSVQHRARSSLKVGPGRAVREEEPREGTGDQSSREVGEAEHRRTQGGLRSPVSGLGRHGRVDGTEARTAGTTAQFLRPCSPGEGRV